MTKQPEDLFIEKYVDHMIEVFEKVYPESMLLLGPFSKGFDWNSEPETRESIISRFNKELRQ
jgi:hypothetical protein